MLNRVLMLNLVPVPTECEYPSSRRSWSNAAEFLHRLFLPTTVPRGPMRAPSTSKIIVGASVQTVFSVGVVGRMPL